MNRFPTNTISEANIEKEQKRLEEKKKRKLEKKKLEASLEMRKSSSVSDQADSGSQTNESLDSSSNSESDDKNRNRILDQESTKKKESIPLAIKKKIQRLSYTFDYEPAEDPGNKPWPKSDRLYKVIKTKKDQKRVGR